MKTFVLIRSISTQCYYIYSMTGHLIQRFVNLAEVSQYIKKLQDTYQMRSVTYTNTCVDEVVMVILK